MEYRALLMDIHMFTYIYIYIYIYVCIASFLNEFPHYDILVFHSTNFASSPPEGDIRRQGDASYLQLLQVYCGKNPMFCEKSHVSYAKSPVFYEKSPIFYTKSPVFSDKSPIFYAKRH